MNATNIPTILIIMGVSGTGKSTIGKSLSQKLGWPYFEGDDFHPEENVKKMREGFPLNDDDREPWLQILRELILKQIKEKQSAIFSSSALKEKYRRTLAGENKEIHFVYLAGSYELIMGRLQQRDHEYMPSTLLTSQFEALEEPQQAIKISIDQQVEEIIEEIIQKISGEIR